MHGIFKGVLSIPIAVENLHEQLTCIPAQLLLYSMGTAVGQLVWTLQQLQGVQHRLDVLVQPSKLCLPHAYAAGLSS
jgi:hypothetical protein